MLAKRIIPCLDIKDWQVVKGTNFVNLQNFWDALLLAEKYCKQWADELVFLDINATNEKRQTLISLVEKIAKNINIPFTVWGGINSIEIMDRLFKAWADKVSLNSAAIKNPKLLQEASEKFGRQSVVVAIDYKKIENWESKIENNYKVFIWWWKTETDWKLSDRCIECEKLWAWELLLTSIDHDGMKQWFDMQIMNQILSIVKLPIIASWWCWSEKDFLDLFQNTVCTWWLWASVFHTWQIDIRNLKKYLYENKISIRL